MSASYAWLADITLMILGGGLKRKEMLSGRFADALGNLYLASSALKRFKDNGEDVKETPLLEWACQYALYQVQQALDGILRNFPMPYAGGLLRVAIFPTGRYLQMPDDRLNQAVAEILQQPGEVRDRLTEDMYISDDSDEITAQIEAAFELSIASYELRKRIKKQGLEQTADKGFDEWLSGLQSINKVNEQEADLLRRTREVVAKVINVDDFPQQPAAAREMELRAAG
jgi:acyl-CoA dehydrogenase